MIIETTTKERNEEFESKYELYKELFYNTTLNSTDILKKLGMSSSNRIYKDIHKRWRLEENINSRQRGQLIHRGKWLE